MSPYAPSARCDRQGTRKLTHLLKGTLLGFRKQEEDHDEGDDVETSVEAERSGRSHRGEHSRESDREDGGPEEASSNSLEVVDEAED